jgi:tetratricopeptide (TPR) repeat protein
MTSITIENVAALLQRGDSETALAACVRATDVAPGDAEAWSTRAFVEEHLEQFDAADASISRAWQIENSPDFRFKRASIRLRAGHLHAALADAFAVAKTNETFLVEEASLMAAEAQRRLGLWAEALATCRKLPDATEFWAGGLISVREIRSQCERMTTQKKAA